MTHIVLWRITTWEYISFHWAEEDSWRYCYDSSRPNEHVGFAVYWLAKKYEVASQRAPVVAVVGEVVKPSILVREKWKRNIVDRMEEEQICKFQVDPLVENEAMAI